MGKEVSTRNWSICILLCVTCLGCSGTEDEVRKTTAGGLKQLGAAMHAYHESLKKQSIKDEIVIASEAEYYTTGPQQGRPADGKFAVGTKITIINESGSYFLVRSTDGVEAYVSAAAVQKQEAPKTETPDDISESNP